MTGMPLGRPTASELPSAPAGEDEPGFAGLLHDLGHQMMTVSLLAESLKSDKDLSADSRRRAELVGQETSRALGMIADHMPAAAPQAASGPQLIDIRMLAEHVTRLAGQTFGTTVVLRPGPPAYLQIDPTLAWRVLWNILDNAARAAGAAGRVEISISRGTGTVIEIEDDGPGYGDSPAGLAGLGTSVITQLLAATGGQLDIAPGRDGGTRVRATFGGQADRILLPRQRQAASATSA